MHQYLRTASRNLWIIKRVTNGCGYLGVGGRKSGLGEWEWIGRKINNWCKVFNTGATVMLAIGTSLYLS